MQFSTFEPSQFTFEPAATPSGMWAEKLSGANALYGSKQQHSWRPSCLKPGEDSPPLMKEEFQHTVFDFTPQQGIRDFWVVTAWNPDSQIHTHSFNKTADEKLEQFLKDEDFVHFRVTGGSPDGLHAEPGWGIVCDEQTALRFCAEFQQDAVFHFSGDCITLVSRDAQSRIQLEGTVQTRMSTFR